MADHPNKIITCRSLAPTIKSLFKPDTELHTLDIALHLQPDRLRNSLIKKIQEIEEDDTVILLGYGLCGRSLEGVYSNKSTLVLMKVDDCVGALLGSRDRHREVLKEHAGRYFLLPRWLDTELNIFTQMSKEMDNIPAEKRKHLLKVALKHYDRLVQLNDDGANKSDARCLELAKEHELILEPMATDLELIKRLLNGPWDESEFVVVPPGTPVPLF